MPPASYRMTVWKFFSNDRNPWKMAIWLHSSFLWSRGYENKHAGRPYSSFSPSIIVCATEWIFHQWCCDENIGREVICSWAKLSSGDFWRLCMWSTPSHVNCAFRPLAPMYSWWFGWPSTLDIRQRVCVWQVAQPLIYIPGFPLASFQKLLLPFPFAECCLLTEQILSISLSNISFLPPSPPSLSLSPSLPPSLTFMIHLSFYFLSIPSPSNLHSWFWGDIPRAEAEKWLLTNNNKSGTFLVRVSSSQKDSLSLSVRDGESVKHYRIRRFDDGSYYVATRITFRSLQVRTFKQKTCTTWFIYMVRLWCT